MGSACTISHIDQFWGSQGVIVDISWFPTSVVAYFSNIDYL